MSITAAPSCAACVFGATATAKYSYTVHILSTVNITVIPHITTFSNAPNITSYETITTTDTIYVGGDGNATAVDSANATTFNSPQDITWTVGDATLTYPTTYIQYLGFVGAAPSNAACAEDTNAKRIELPYSTARESFMYPYNESQSLLPAELLNYLGTIETITEQLDDAMPATCVPLSVTPAPSTTYITLESRREAKRYEGARRDVASSQAIVEVGGNNYTYWLMQRQATDGTAPYGTGIGGTEPFVPTEFSSSTTSLALTLTSASSRAESTVLMTTGPANDHTTAFVLNTVTGRAIVVSGDTTPVPVVIGEDPASAHSPSPTDKNIERPTSANDNGESPQTTQKSTKPDIPAIIQSAAEGQQSQPTNRIPDIIASIAAGQNPAQDQSAPSQGVDSVSNDGSSLSQPGGTKNQESQPTATQGPLFSVGNTVISANSDGSIEIGTQVLTPGQTVNFGSGASPTTLVVQTSGGSTQLVVDGNTLQPFSGDAPATAAPAVFTADGQSFTAVQNGNSIIVAGGSSTFTLPAGSASTVGRVEISAPSDGSAVVVNGRTLQISQATPSPTAIVTAGGETFSAVQSGGSVLLFGGSSTIAIGAGSQTVINGHTFSAASSGSAVIIDGSTLPVGNAATPTQAQIVVTGNDNALLTAVDGAGSVILKDASSTVTLKDGSQTTFDGQTVSVLPKGNAIVVNGSATSSFGSAATSTGVGDYINGGLGSSATSIGAGTSGSGTPESAADRIRVFASAGVIGVLVIVSVLL